MVMSDKNSIFNLKQAETRLTMFDLEMVISKEERENFYDNPKEFLKKQIEERGFKVNDVIIEKDLRNNVNEKRNVDLFTIIMILVHIEYDKHHPERESRWIYVPWYLPNPPNPS